MEKEAEQRIFRNGEKIRKILSLVKNEVDAPVTYYVLDKLCDKLALPVPSVENFLKVLKERGFQAVLTHFNSKGIKTDASAADVKKLLQMVVTAV